MILGLDCTECFVNHDILLINYILKLYYWRMLFGSKIIIMLLSRRKLPQIVSTLIKTMLKSNVK